MGDDNILLASLTNYASPTEDDAEALQAKNATTNNIGRQTTPIVSPESSAESPGRTTTAQSPSSKENKEARRRKLRGMAVLSDPRDQSDEYDDEEDSSSLGYSDDSASFTGDAYFHPQAEDSLAQPYGRLVLGNGPVNPYQVPAPPPPMQITAATSYGSLQYSAAGSHGSFSHFWLGEPIQEDAEAVAPYYYQNSSQSSLDHVANGEATALLANTRTNPKAKRDRRGRPRGKSRSLHRMHMKQREQILREKAVYKVRGKPQQLTSWQDSFWTILFLVQLILIVLCALRFGFGVILFKDHPVWGKKPTNAWHNSVVSTTTTKHKGSSVTQPVPTVPKTKPTRRLADASKPMANSTVSFNATSADNDVSVPVVPANATLKDILFSQDDAFLKSDDILASESSIANGSFTIDYKNVLAITFFAGFYACILSYISFGFMLILARSLILVMLIFSILVALAWGIIGLTLDPYGVISVMGFAALISTLGYTMYSWHRIPFAATNLCTALTAMRCTADITIIGLMSLVVAFGWCLLWSTAFIGIVNAFNHNDCDTKDACQAHVNSNHLPLYLLLLLSFHWTTMVIKNVVRVTVASAIGTWWFQPNEIGPFCTAAVTLPLLRSLTLSLGSICMGSLIIGPAQLCLWLFRLCCCCMEGSEGESLTCVGSDGNSGKPLPFVSLQNGGDTDDGTGVVADARTTVDSAADTVGVCRRCRALFQPCQRWLRSCNRWSFTYIGMYGYSFIEAGGRALQLFEARGWMEVVEDPLIQNVLMMASITIGGSTGVFAVVVEETDGFDFTSFHQPIVTAFVIGSVLGYVLSNILLLGVVGSAVNTVLVCFAAGPFDFDKNHPRLSREMRMVWSQQVWEPSAAPSTFPVASAAPNVPGVAAETAPAARDSKNEISIESMT